MAWRSTQTNAPMICTRTTFRWMTHKARVVLDEKTRLVSYLPLSHIAAMGIDSAIYCGSFLRRPSHNYCGAHGGGVASMASWRRRRVDGVTIPDAVTASPTQAPRSTSPTPWRSKTLKTTLLSM